MTEQIETFTVIMPDLLRERFDRWLMRNHLQMVTVSACVPGLYMVSPSGPPSPPPPSGLPS